MHFAVVENTEPYKNGFANKPSGGCNPSRPGNGDTLCLLSKSKGQFWSFTSWRKSKGVIQCLSVISPKKRHRQVNKYPWTKSTTGEVTQWAWLWNTTVRQLQESQKAHLPLLLCLIQMCSQLELTVLLVCARHFFQSQYFVRNNVECDW